MPKKIIHDDALPKHRPLSSPENEEQKLIALSMKLAEKQMREGTASSQVITHFLRLATKQAELETEKTKKEIALLEQKKISIEHAEKSEERFQEAIEAMKRYSGNG